MPLVRTAVTAGDHIDWITTSPDAIRFTLSLKSFHSARNWPAFFLSIRKFDTVWHSLDVRLPGLPISASLWNLR